MPLLNDLQTEYYRRHPTREGRNIDLPDWLPALLSVLDRRLAAFAGCINPPAAEERE